MLDELRIYSKKCLLKDGTGAPWIYYESTAKPFWLNSGGRGVCCTTTKNGWWRGACEGGVGFFFFCGGQDNLGSNHLMKSFLSSEEFPKVLEIGRDVFFFQSSIRRPQI